MAVEKKGTAHHADQEELRIIGQFCRVLQKLPAGLECNPPLFASFLNLSNGRIDKAKILTVDRAREISRPVSKDISFNKASLGFIETSWVIIGSTLVTLWPPANLIRLSWKFFCDSSNHITEVIFSVFENLAPVVFFWGNQAEIWIQRWLSELQNTAKRCEST